MTDVEKSQGLGKAPPPRQVEKKGFFSDVKDATLPPNHPINALTATRKFVILCILAYTGFVPNFSIAIVLTAFPELGQAFGVSPGAIPNTIGYSLLGFAIGPLIWNPLSRTIGRRPVYVIGSFLQIPCAIWLALSPSYNCFSAARFFASFFTAFSQTVPPATIADIFVPSVRGSKMSAFTVAVVIAPVLAPLICSAVISQGNSWHVLFWIILGMAVLQFLLFFFLVPETLWVKENENATDSAAVGDGNESEKEDTHKNMPPLALRLTDYTSGYDTAAGGVRPHHGHVGAAWMPWRRPGEFFKVMASPIIMAQYIPIVTVSIYYGMLFAWSVGITIVMPQLFDKPPYGFSEIALGCAFLAFGIGAVLGKWSGGVVGDIIVNRLTAKHGVRSPEYRLWGVLPLLPFMMAALCVVGASIEKEWHWAALLVAGGIYYFCFSATTGLLQTYVSECYITKPMDAQAVFVFFKSIWGFVIPFFISVWGGSNGFLTEYCIQGALAFVIGIFLCTLFLAKGRSIRKWQGMPLDG